MRRDLAAPMVLMTGVLAAPFVAAWPLFQRHGEAMAPAFDLWSARLLWATIFGAVAAFLAHRDLFLGLAVGLAVVDVLFRPIESVGKSTVGIFALGALGLAWVRSWALDARRVAGHVLGVIAMLEALVMLGQLCGINPLWGVWSRGAASPLHMTGTLGNTAFASMLVAIAGPFAPWQALPVMALILCYAQSKIAILAFALACAVRFLPTKWALVAVLVAALLFTLGLLATVSGHARLWVWNESLRALSIFGDGLGTTPTIRAVEGPALDPAGWRNVHNDLLQWTRERGYVGLVIALAWLVALGRSLTGPRVALAGLAALVLVALAQSPFYVIPTGLVGVVVLGLASPTLLTSDPTGA